MRTSQQDIALARDCTAVIFCGGRATRLQSELLGRPKALVPLGREPYLHGLLHQLHNASLREVVLCVSPFTRDITDDIRDGSKFALTIRYSIDTGLYENAHALWHCRDQIHTSLAVCINGDTVVDVDFRQALRAHLRSGAIGTIVASSRADQPHPRAVEVGLDGMVVDIHEWAQDRQMEFQVSPFSGFYSNSGIYVMDMERLGNDWACEERIGKIEQGLLRTLARRKELFAFQNGFRYLVDIGTPERLAAARSQIRIMSEFFIA